MALTDANKKWAYISTLFDDALVKEWTDKGFTYETCRDWMAINSTGDVEVEIYNVDFYFWLVKFKKLESDYVLNFGDAVALRDEFVNHWAGNVYDAEKKTYADLDTEIKKLEANTTRTKAEDAKLAKFQAQKKSRDDYYKYTDGGIKGDYYDKYTTGTKPKPYVYFLEKKEKSTVLGWLDDAGIKAAKDASKAQPGLNEYQTPEHLLNQAYLKSLIPHNWETPEKNTLEDWEKKEKMMTSAENKAIRKYLIKNSNEIFKNAGWIPGQNDLVDKKLFTLKEIDFIQKNIALDAKKEAYIAGVKDGTITPKLAQEQVFPQFKYTYLVNPTYYYNKTGRIFVEDRKHLPV